MFGLFRMVRWARRPPSRRQALLIAGVVLACLALAIAEQIWGWPEALTVNRVPRGPGF